MCRLDPNVALVLFLSLVFVTIQRPRPTACVHNVLKLPGSGCLHKSGHIHVHEEPKRHADLPFHLSSVLFVGNGALQKLFFCIM